MKNILIIVGCATLLMFSASAYSAQGAYFGGSVGMTLPTDAGLGLSDIDDMGVSIDVASKSGLGLGVALGYDFGNSMRVEGEFAYQKNDLDKMTASYMGFSASLGLEGEATSTAFMVNGYYDFTNLSALTPFLGAGIGYAKVETEITELTGYEGIEGEEDLELAGSEDDTALAYQVGAGIGWAVSETLTLDAKYRYFATEDLDFEGASLEYSSHNFYVGIRLGF